ncbi:MAG TPA: adenylate/guanylate cyclase domain-containing protein [Candidatus Omnitrophota bacterium]|nr:adenylate/guanylate cyclase domain-containing protein [Candidatus Omnitrophota bacterium]HRZ14436.1 adenylate/guanylate cyclase domain-containing protein [Candidatus Omnitrophota bacterium]
MNKKTRIKLLVSLAFALGVAGLLLLSLQSRAYQILELKALDLRFILRGAMPTRGPIVHIDIDEKSLDRVGRWPWPRSYHAQLTSFLKECGAKQVLWDVIFSEEFKDDPQQDALFNDAIYRSAITYLPFYFDEVKAFPFPKLKELLLKKIDLSAREAAAHLGIDIKMVGEKLPEARRMLLEEVARELLRKQPDSSFEDILDQMEKTYGWFLFDAEEIIVQGEVEHQKLVDFFVKRFAADIPVDRWPFKKESGRLNVPIRLFAERMKGSGFINADPDLDGVTRKVPLFVRYHDNILPQLTVAALLDRLEVKKVEIGRNRIIFKGARFHPGIKDIVIPVDEQGCMLVNWHGTWDSTFKHVSYGDILELQQNRRRLEQPGEALTEKELAYWRKDAQKLKDLLASIVRDKICIVGLTATGTHDLRPIPLQDHYPMVGTHSNLINTILTERFIVRQSALPRILIFLFTALVVGFSSLLKLWKSLLIVLGYAVGFFLLALYLFITAGLWIDLVGPTGIVVFGFMSITSFRFFTEEKEKLWIKHAFGHYLSDAVITELLDDPSRLKLGGERRMLTVIFSDVRGFTSFSESHQPEEVVAMLNEILTQQVDVVFKYNGTLDKFVGDELMAFFGAPGNQHVNNHALMAVRTAIEIQEKMKGLKTKWDQEKKQALQIGIGINTGDMVVGNMGSAARMDYTVIGDNVNLGARLCAAASKDEIIISEGTYEQVKDQINVEKLEPISVKGKAKPISIYRVVGLK